MGVARLTFWGIIDPSVGDPFHADPTSSRMKTTNSVNVELLLFLVANLSATVKSVTAQSISRSNIFDTDDEMAQFWEMLHWSTQDDMAADVNAVLSGIDETLGWLW